MQFQFYKSNKSDRLQMKAVELLKKENKVDLLLLIVYNYSCNKITALIIRKVKSMKTILFQGDSITDCGRYRKVTDKKENGIAFFRDGRLFKKITALGEGYPAKVTAELKKAFPDEYRYINRGVGGDRITDVYSRIVKDIIKLKPDYMSLLVGVNDVWRNYDSEGTGTGKARFEKVYNMLLEELKEELPQLKIIIMGPFVLPGTATAAVKDRPDCYADFRRDVEELAEITKSAAEKYGCAYIDLQKVLDEASKGCVAGELSGDGVHPSDKGHEIITREWIKAFSELGEE